MTTTTSAAAIQYLNDRGKQGRTVREWKFGLGNQAQELEVLCIISTYAAAKRAALARAVEAGYTVVECYRDPYGQA